MEWMLSNFKTSLTGSALTCSAVVLVLNRERITSCSQGKNSKKNLFFFFLNHQKQFQWKIKIVSAYQFSLFKIRDKETHLFFKDIES